MACRSPEDIDVKDGQVASDALKQRLEMLVRDLRVYGEVLARQRRADLAGTDAGLPGAAQEVIRDA